MEYINIRSLKFMAFCACLARDVRWTDQSRNVIGSEWASLIFFLPTGMLMVWPGLTAATICNPLIPNPIKLNEAAAAACSSTDEAREKKEAKSPLCIHDLLRFRSYPFYDTFANWPQPACPHLILSHLHIYEYHNITRSIPPLRRLSVKANDKTNLDLRFIFSAFSVLRQSRSRKKREMTS